MKERKSESGRERAKVRDRDRYRAEVASEIVRYGCGKTGWGGKLSINGTK